MFTQAWCHVTRRRGAPRAGDTGGGAQGSSLSPPEFAAGGGAGVAQMIGEVGIGETMASIWKVAIAHVALFIICMGAVLTV